MPEPVVKHWEEQHTVHTYDVDFTNRIRISALFNLMQEAAATHAQHLGYGFAHMQEKGVFWVLSRIRLEVLGPKCQGEQIIVETWPRAIDGIFALRDFRLKDAHTGEAFCLATSSWLIVDVKSMRPQRPSSFFHDERLLDSQGALPDPAGKVKAVPHPEFVYRKDIRYTDLDMNRHVNHVKYIEYLQDAFAPSFYEQAEIKSMLLNFNHESRMGDALSLSRADAGEYTHYIEAHNQDDKLIFQACVGWQPLL